MLNNPVNPLTPLRKVNLLLWGLRKRAASQNPPRCGRKVLPVVSSLLKAQLIYGFETKGRWKLSETAASWRLSRRNTLIAQVSMFPLQNLICLRIQVQIDGITPYTTTIYCTAHIQIVFIVSLFTKQFYVHVSHFSAMSLSLNKHITKKFFKLTNLVQIRLKLNKKRLQTSTDSSVVDCTACPLFFGRFLGREVWRGEGPEGSNSGIELRCFTSRVCPVFGKLCWNSSRI